LDYYELAQEPFSNAPVSRFYFNSPQHSQALVRLTHLCSQMKGLGILVGDIGAGKTTLARRLLDSLPENEYDAALLVIIHSGVTAQWLLKRIALQLGVDAPSEDKLTLLGQLYPPLAQRVALKYRLDHLNADSTEAYIKHRLRLAGAARMPFTPGAVQSVHRFSSGTPRVVNTLCDNALFEGYVARVPMIDEQMIERVARELALDGNPPAANAAPPRRGVSGAPAAEKGKPVDLGEIDRYLAGLAKPS